VKTRLHLLLICFVAFAVAAEIRTWTFREDGNFKVLSGTGGKLSFRKNGRIDADFIQSDLTNVFLKLKDGRDGSVPLTNLSDDDRAYVDKVKDLPIDLDKLNREAEARKMLNRMRANAQAAETARKEAEATGAYQTKQAVQRQNSAQEAARLAKFQPLLDGRPEPMTYDYFIARKTIEQVVTGRSPIYAPYAQQILMWSDEITRARLNGNKPLVSGNAELIRHNLQLLLDDDIIR